MLLGCVLIAHLISFKGRSWEELSMCMLGDYGNMVIAVKEKVLIVSMISHGFIFHCS